MALYPHGLGDMIRNQSRFVGATFMPHAHGQPLRDWKTLAALLAAENDPEKVLELARQLITSLDENSSTVLGKVAPESKKSAA